MSQTVYVFQTPKGSIIEVVLTGRKAVKKARRRPIELFEIEALDKEAAFKTWVRMEQLFVVDEDK